MVHPKATKFVNRTSNDIIAECLTVLTKEPMGKTALMYHTMMSYTQLEGFKAYLLDKGLVQLEGKKLVITEKGRDVLDAYTNFKEALNAA